MIRSSIHGVKHFFFPFIWGTTPENSQGTWGGARVRVKYANAGRSPSPPAAVASASASFVFVRYGANERCPLTRVTSDARDPRRGNKDRSWRRWPPRLYSTRSGRRVTSTHRGRCNTAARSANQNNGPTAGAGPFCIRPAKGGDRRGFRVRGGFITRQGPVPFFLSVFSAAPATLRCAPACVCVCVCVCVQNGADGKTEKDKKKEGGEPTKATNSLSSAESPEQSATPPVVLDGFLLTGNRFCFSVASGFFYSFGLSIFKIRILFGTKIPFIWLDW